MNSNVVKENWISIKIKTGGSTPGRHPVLSVGATFVDNPYNSFYCETIPLPYIFVPHFVQDAFPQEIPAKAMRRLAKSGISLKDCITNFLGWLYSNIVYEEKMVLTSWWAHHDWAFLDYMFSETEMGNPFSTVGIIDLKTMWMVHKKLQWTEIPPDIPDVGALRSAPDATTKQAEWEAIEQTHIAHKIRSENSDIFATQSRTRYDIMLNRKI